MVERLKGTVKDLTGEKFLETMSTMKNFTGTREIELNFSDDEYPGSRTISIVQCKSAIEIKKEAKLLQEIEMEKKLLPCRKNIE